MFNLTGTRVTLLSTRGGDNEDHELGSEFGGEFVMSDREY